MRLRPPRLLAHLLADRRGATALEFALVAPLLLSLLLAAVEAGRYLWVDAVVGHAMRDAARCASLDPVGCPPGTMALRINDKLASLGVPLKADVADFTLASEPCGTRVLLRLPYAPLIGGLWPTVPELSADACIAQA